jgi:alkanesulfonate monooxygenase SsuD/methylene tetrahydromethanopterin reductase-like flavin-dependent oxidoreductase (luciferase family)
VWSGDVVEHQSDFLSWSGFKSYPLPVQSPLPVVIGGAKGKAFERIAKYGQGWYAPTTSTAELAELLVKLDAACEAEGRDRSTVEISAMWTPGGDPVEAFEELGVSRLVVPLPALVAGAGGNPIEAVQKFGADWLS